MNASELGWSEFYVAVAGAAAALAGLIIVAMSVNIERILSTRSIPARAASAIGALVLAVAGCCLGLVPGQPLWALGVEVLVGTVVLWVLWIIVLRDVLADRTPEQPGLPRFGAAVVAPALFTVSGIVLLAGGVGGLYWLAAASVVAIVAGVVFSWIALVEILR
jgi:hypothetical protein